MQIEIIAGAASNAAPATESTGAADAPVTGKGSFADLLDAVADEQIESPGDEGDEDLSAVAEWMTVPVVAPFVPAIPQNIVEIEDGNATSVEAIGEDIAVDADDAPLPEVVAASPDVESIVDDEAPKPQAARPKGEPKPEPVTTESSAPVTPVAEASTIDVVADIQTAPAATDVPAEIDASIEPKPSMNVEQTRAAKPVKAAAKAPDINEATRPAVEEAVANNTLPIAASDITVRPGSQTENPHSEPLSNKGVAARFARAVERAIEHAAAPAAAAGENGQASNQNDDGQPSFGEWLREQLPQLAAARAQTGAAPVFALAAPAQNDPRVSGLLATSGLNLPAGTSALPNEHDVTLQIVQSMRMQFRDGIGEAVLRLKPEHLGSVSISLRVENGGLKANVQADMPAVRQWLESQQDTLRSALADHGLRLDRFDIEPDAQRQQTDDEGRRDEQSTRRRRPRRTAQEDEPVFEVVV